jgi:hypothetical protein
MNLNFLQKDKQAQSSMAGRVGGVAADRTVDLSGYNKAMSFILKALVFLVPILFLTITSEAREFNKQSLIFFGVVVMLGVWVMKILTTRSASWVKTSLDYIILSYLAIYLISSWMSLDKVSSFLGYYGRFTGSFLSVLAMVIFYFLVVNNIRNLRASQNITKWLTLSSYVVLGYSLLQLLGLYILPFAKDRAFNPVGSMVALAVFAALFVVFYQWQLLTQSQTKASRIALTVFSVVGLVVLFLVNAFVAWIVLALAMVAFLALGMVLTGHDNPNPAWFWKPLLVLVVAILFVAFQFLPQSINPRNIVRIGDLPVEIQLSNSATWDLVGNSLKSGAKPAILGSGPGTTGIAFGQIKPEALNKTIVWSLNFDRGSTELANVIIETGVLGLLAFELTAVLFLFYALYFLLKKTGHPGRMYAFGFFVFWLGLYVTHFFYFFNTTFYFLYWLSLAMFMAITHWQEGEVEASNLTFSSSPRSALSWMFASLLMLAVLLVGGFFQAAVYAAELSYTSGIKTLNQEKPDFAKAEGQFAQAVNLNQYRDVYYLAYGQNLVFRASEEAAKQDANISNIQAWISNLIAAGQTATNISPNKPSNWSALAQFYTNIRPLGVEGTDDAIIRAWETAVSKDDRNPALLIQLGRAYATAAEVIDPSIAGTGADADQDGLSDAKEQELGSNPQASDSNDNGVSDGDEVKAGFNPSGAGRLTTAQISQFIKLDSKRIKQAEDALRKAVSLKEDLPDSRIELARVLERANKLAEARTVLDEAVKLFPGNPEVKFEQGRITFNQKNYTEAEKFFLEVVRMQPNHANAHYSLGLVYQQRGDKAKALAQFEKVREITGPNVDLEKLINSLKEQTPSQ